MNSHSPDPECGALEIMLPDAYLIAALMDLGTELRA